LNSRALAIEAKDLVSKAKRTMHQSGLSRREKHETTRDYSTRFNRALTLSLHEVSGREHLSLEKEQKMQSPSIFVAILLLAVTPLAALAQPANKTRTHADVDPPPVEKVLASTTTQFNGVLASVIAGKPEIPLGPLDVLKGYENEMTLVVQRISAELASISQADQANQITRAQAEYLIQERYQVAMMQHQVLCALHDTLEHDVVQAVAKPPSAADSNTAVVVEAPFSRPARTQ
jgi:hypothetical protein